MAEQLLSVILVNLTGDAGGYSCYIGIIFMHLHKMLCEDIQSGGKQVDGKNERNYNLTIKNAQTEQPARGKGA